MENIYVTGVQDEIVSAEVNPVNRTENENSIHVLDVTRLQPKEKHPAIFGQFDALKPGDVLEIINDHDPKPLYYQLIAIRGDYFTWTYLEEGPEWWRVQIGKKEADTTETVGEIAAKNFYKAAVLKEYGIDFCCGGKKTLRQACAEKGLNIRVVEAALSKEESVSRISINYTTWNPDFLADYIYNNHHLYYYSEAPVIADLLEKVLNHHGETYPELEQVAALYNGLVVELKSHFREEETVLFPFIKYLVGLKQKDDNEPLQKQYSVSWPVKMMEDDHTEAGEILAELSRVTNQYTAPEEAYTAFQLLYQKLKELQEDLQQHIHLENNVLFPKVLQLENELRHSIL